MIECSRKIRSARAGGSPSHTDFLCKLIVSSATVILIGLVMTVKLQLHQPQTRHVLQNVQVAFSMWNRAEA